MFRRKIQKQKAKNKNILKKPGKMRLL